MSTRLEADHAIKLWILDAALEFSLFEFETLWLVLGCNTRKSIAQISEILLQLETLQAWNFTSQGSLRPQSQYKKAEVLLEKNRTT